MFGGHTKKKRSSLIYHRVWRWCELTTTSRPRDMWDFTYILETVSIDLSPLLFDNGFGSPRGPHTHPSVYFMLYLWIKGRNTPRGWRWRCRPAMPAYGTPRSLVSQWASQSASQSVSWLVGYIGSCWPHRIEIPDRSHTATRLATHK